MPISKKMNNLLQRSKAACHTASWHIVLSDSAGGRFMLQELISWLLGDAELYRKIKNYIMNHVTEKPVDYATTHTLAYAHMSCSPSSAEWKQPSEKSLDTSWFLLDIDGGMRKKKLGVGPAQLG